MLLTIATITACSSIAPLADRGTYTVPGLGERKQQILASGGNVRDLAIAMLETEHMSVKDYPYGDNKHNDAANFGIFKQNWHMLRVSDVQYRQYSAHNYTRGADINGDLVRDIKALHTSQAYYGMDAWFMGHRGGESALLGHHANTDIRQYQAAVLWIQHQIERNPTYLRDDTRIWVRVPAI